MIYKKMRLTVYNEKPDEPWSWHVDVTIDGDFTQEQMLEALVKPAFYCAFSKLIPEMPETVIDGEMNPKFIEWESKHYGGLDA